MKLFVKEEGCYNYNLKGWIIVFVFELSVLIYFNFFSWESYSFLFGLLNILCFFGGIALGTDAKKVFLPMKNFQNEVKNTNNQNTERN